MRHKLLVDLAGALAGGGKVGGFGEGLAEAVGGLLDLAAGIADLGEGLGLVRFELAGPGTTTTVPAVFNTSLNAGWKPIVASPEQTLGFFFYSAADALVINSFVMTKEEQLKLSTP
jgi:hypothetical protein